MKFDWIIARRFELAALGVAVLLVWIYTRNNSFPHEYHNDEPSKTQQIISGERNLRHPPLMLEATAVALKWSGLEPNRQNAAVCGRWLSAVAVAFACASMGWLLTRIVPSMLSVAVGLLTGLQPAIFEAAHFLKEDSWFLAGTAGVFLAVHFVVEKPSGRRVLLLGIALGLAASTKYVGWTFLPFAVGLACFKLSWRAGGIVIATAVVTAAVVMIPALMLGGPLRQSMTEEIGWMLGGHFGVGNQVPHGVYLWVLYRDVSLWILIPACAGVAGYMNASRIRVVWLLAGGYATGLVVVMSFFAKTSDRYVLPVLLIVLPMAWLAASRAGTWFPKRIRYYLGSCVFGFWALLSWPGFHARFEAFAKDSRGEMVEWMRTHLPSGSLIVEDKKVNLALHVQRGWEVECSEFFAADCGTLAELRERGVTHVAGSWDVHHRYVESHLRPGDSEEFKTRAAFYLRLHEEMPLIWSVHGREPKALHPGLFLFELKAP